MPLYRSQELKKQNKTNQKNNNNNNNRTVKFLCMEKWNILTWWNTNTKHNKSHTKTISNNSVVSFTLLLIIFPIKTLKSFSLPIYKNSQCPHQICSFHHKLEKRLRIHPLTFLISFPFKFKKKSFSIYKCLQCSHQICSFHHKLEKKKKKQVENTPFYFSHPLSF